MVGRAKAGHIERAGGYAHRRYYADTHNSLIRLVGMRRGGRINQAPGRSTLRWKEVAGSR